MNWNQFSDSRGSGFNYWNNFLYCDQTNSNVFGLNSVFFNNCKWHRHEKKKKIMTGQINNLMHSDIINSGKFSNYFCLFMYYLFSLFKLLYWRECKTSKTQSGLLTLTFFHGISKHSYCSITNHIVLVTSDPADNFDMYISNINWFTNWINSLKWTLKGKIRL